MLRSFLVLGAVAVIGCSSQGGEVKVGIDVAPLATSSSSKVYAQSLTKASPTVANNTQTGGTIAIQRVRLLVADAKVQGGGNGRGSGKMCGGGNGGDSQNEAGPYVVDLAASDLASGAHREFSITAAAGTYEEAEIEIKPIERDDLAKVSSDATFADFTTSGASLLIDGTYNGKAFQFAGHFKAEQGKEASITVDASTPVSVPFAVDATKWFLDASGAVLDPTDPAQHSAIAVGICKTLDTEVESAAQSNTSAHPGGRDHGGPGANHCVE